MMRKNSSVDLSLFLLIAKIGKTRGLKGEFFLRSFAQNPEALFSFKKFYALSSSTMQEVHFEFMKQSNANIIAKLKSINDIDGIKAFGQKDIFVLKSGLLQQFLNDFRDIMVYGKSSQFIDERTIQTENLNITMP